MSLQKILAQYYKLRSMKRTINCVVLLLLSFLFLVGCNEPAMLDATAGKHFGSLDEISKEFLQKQNNIQPLRAVGDGSIEFVDKNGKRSKEGLTKVNIFLSPPDRMYVSIDHLLQSKAIRFGATGREFWCWIKFSEMNDYYWGEQGLLAQNCIMPYGLRPEVVYESLGFVDIQSQMNHSELSFNGRNSVVSVKNGDGKTIKNYTLDPSGSQVVRIDYFGEFRSPFLITEMKNFKKFSNYGNYYLPGKIVLASQDGRMVLNFNMKKVEPVNHPTKLEKLFIRPSPRGAKNIFRMNSSCEFVMQ